MIDRFRDIARALVAVLLLGIAGAGAQTAQSQTSPNPAAPSQAGSVPTAQVPAQLAGQAGPKINIAEITARANRDVDKLGRLGLLDEFAGVRARRIALKKNADAPAVKREAEEEWGRDKWR